MSIFSPKSLPEALQIINEYPSARLLAGGTDTMVEINFRHFEPGDIISLRHIQELQAFETLNASYRVGASIPYKEFENGAYGSSEFGGGAGRRGVDDARACGRRSGVCGVAGALGIAGEATDRADRAQRE